MQSKNTIKLIELSNTWQGEGPDCGRQMLLARFKYCNLACKYCDTMIKMKTAIEGEFTIDEINAALIKTKALMITGGEPTLDISKADNLASTIWMLKKCDYQTVNIETNGCNIELLLDAIDNQIKNPERIKVIYSPKFSKFSDLDNNLAKSKSVINHPSVYFKIVVDNSDIYDVIKTYIKELSEMTDNRGKIYLMPLGITYQEIMKNWKDCIDVADEYSVNLSTRMHIVNDFI